MELNINRDNYRDYPAINYSKLSSLSKNPKSVNEDKDFSDGLRNGDVLDTLCFDGEEKFHEKYYVSTLSKLPSDAVRSILERIASMETYTKETIVEVARQQNYGGNWKDGTVYKKVMEDGEEYLQMLEASKGKHIIDFQDFASLNNAVTNLKEHPWTSFMFDGEFQVPLLSNLKVNDDLELLFKGLADSVIVKDDRVILIDLKYSSSSLRYFKSDFKKWNYYLQAALYADLLKSIFNKPVEVYYVVYSSIQNIPGVFHITPDTLDIGRNGGILYNGESVKGYKQLAQELQWHEKHNLWEYPYEVYQNKMYTLDVTK